MLKNYIQTAFRILFRNQTFSLINIFGLAIGLTCVIIIFLFINYELSFDKHHPNFENIYRVVKKDFKNDHEQYEAAVPVPLSAALKDNLTGSNHVTQVYYHYEELLRVGEKKYQERGMFFVDTNYVKVFDLEFISGSAKDLNDPNNLFLTEKIAEKFFGSVEQAIGKTVQVKDSILLHVKGVVENPPPTSHIPYTMILSWSSLSDVFFQFEYDSWGSIISGFGTYLSLKENVHPTAVNPQINEIVVQSSGLEDEPLKSKYYLQPLQEIHFDERFETYSGSYITSKRFIWIFTSVAFFILLIAFINFTNLSLVQTIKRTKEVGIRKVLGADRRRLIKQFLGETFILLLIAEIIAVILTEVVLSKINQILGNNIELKLYGDISLISFLLLVVFVLTFLSGIYPALALSKYNPIKALRYTTDARSKKTPTLFSLLVVFQFFVSQVLIVSAIIISLQINYFRKKDLGFDKENIFLINVPVNQVNKGGLLIHRLSQVPEVKKLSLGIGAPIARSNINSNFKIQGHEDDYYANIKAVDTAYYTLYNLKLIAGKWYSQSNPKDTSFNIVVNKSLIQKIGIQNPEDAIDTYMKIFGSDHARIIGVVDDFHLNSLQHNISPVVFMPFEQFFFQLHIKTNGIDFTSIKPELEKAWDEIFPEYFFSYEILKDEIQERYSTEKRTSDIVKLFTFIAIIIACLGLYGLVSFMLVQRTKEIGIRKALGASIPSLILLVSKRFLKLIVVSCLLAWPVAYYLMNNWLKEYAFKIEIQFWVFLLAGILLLLITFFTIFYQAFKVSKTNPVDVLKYE
ncbi:MAG: FtsX-like permease family protein [Bacteroidales bacterium]|jgi:predicted permease|nr:FtsX-like permease family protein [Bacteroidales bacterium]